MTERAVRRPREQRGALACGSSGCVSAAAWRAGGVSGTASETTSGTTGKRHVRRGARQARGSAPAGAARGSGERMARARHGRASGSGKRTGEPARRTGEQNGALSVQFRHTFITVVTSCTQAVRSCGLPSPGWMSGGGGCPWGCWTARRCCLAAPPSAAAGQLYPARRPGRSAAGGPTRADCPQPLRDLLDQQLLPPPASAA